MERIQRALLQLKSSGRHLPQSLLGIAMDYTLGRWPTLEVYLGDVRVEIDNNLVENAIRPAALGKKNWLFVGQAEAGDQTAIIYTIIESCRWKRLKKAGKARNKPKINDLHRLLSGYALPLWLQQSW